jgi:hypothetical protein
MPRIANDAVTITLSEDWKDCSSGDVISFANQGTAEELVVGVYQLKEAPDPAHASGIVLNFMQHKASAFGVAAQGAFEVLDASDPRAGVPCVANFSGLDTRNSVYSSVRDRCGERYVLNITYHKHNCSNVSEDVAKRAQHVLGACESAA